MRGYQQKGNNDMTDDEPQPVTRTDLKGMTPQQILTHYEAGDLDILLGRTTPNDSE